MIAVMEKVYKVKKYRNFGFEMFLETYDVFSEIVETKSDSYYIAVKASLSFHTQLQKRFKTGVTLIASRR